MAALTLVLGALLGYVGFLLADSYLTFRRDIANEAFDPAAAAAALATATTAPSTTTTTLLADVRDSWAASLAIKEEKDRPFSIPTAMSPELPDDMFLSVLLIGSDASGALADVIIDVLIPSDGASPMMVSIPRDLYLPNSCKGGYSKVNSALGGCRGVASGPELLALTVGAFTGIEVDHYARVSFEGFSTVIDRMGGITACVGDYPVRDEKSGLALEAGCHDVGGDMALAWVRSRNPERFVDGVWEEVPGSDFDRQRKEQDALFQLARKLASYSSLGSLSGALENLASAVRMDSGWTIGEIASLGVQYRGIDPASIPRLSIPVDDYRTGGGAAVLIPTKTFNEVLAATYPKAAR
jgi:LCP family protein required for cell wall assembly